MTDVLIARLSATASGEDQPRVRRLLHAVAERQLNDAIATASLPPGEWCVRRLDVPVLLDAGHTDTAVQTAWAAQITATLSRLLRSAPPDGEQVVHYPRAHDALADLLGALAVGRTDRAWAWRQLALLEPGAPDPRLAPGRAALAALRRRPAETVPALTAAIQLAGPDALHRLLGSAGWAELSHQVIALHRADGGLTVPWRPDGEPAAPHRSGSPGPVSPAIARRPEQRGDPRPAGRQDGQPPAARQPQTRLASSIRQRSRLAAAFARAHIRPDPTTASAWAVLTIAEVEPALLGRPAARIVLAELSLCFARAPSAVTVRPESQPAPANPADRVNPADRANPAGQPKQADPPGRAAPASRAVQGPPARHPDRDREAGPVAAPGPVAEAGPAAWPTDWAGLLFFLATAADAGLPDAILADEVLADRPFSWSLYQLARRLVAVAEPADPALFALAGLVPGDEPEPPDANEAARLDAHADGWARVTAARLGRAEDDAMDVARELAARTGSIVAGPGWIEVHLALGDVDIGVRRAGLDLDPGWVPWLGAVVIFIYA